MTVQAYNKPKFPWLYGNELIQVQAYGPQNQRIPGSWYISKNKLTTVGISVDFGNILHASIKHKSGLMPSLEEVNQVCKTVFPFGAIIQRVDKPSEIDGDIVVHLFWVEGSYTIGPN